MLVSGMSAVITGGGSGMGAETAKALTQAGAKVALLDINKEGMAEVAAQTGALPVACDVTSGPAMETAIAQAAEAHGAARILVNCAGVAPAKRMVGRNGPMPLEDFERVVDINLNGTFNAMRMFLAGCMPLDPLDEIGERGVIINTTSIAAFDGQIGQAAYASSKGAVAALTLPAARECSQFGIRVVTIAPGLIGTPMLLGMPEEVQQSLAAQVPFPKRFGQPNEYSKLVLHIIDNQMINGDVIRLDGAIRMQAK